MRIFLILTSISDCLHTFTPDSLGRADSAGPPYLIDVVKYTGDPLAHLFALLFIHTACDDGRCSRVQIGGDKCWRGMVFLFTVTPAFDRRFLVPRDRRAGGACRSARERRNLLSTGSGAVFDDLLCIVFVFSAEYFTEADNPWEMTCMRGPYPAFWGDCFVNRVCVLLAVRTAECSVRGGGDVGVTPTRELCAGRCREAEDVAMFRHGTCAPTLRRFQQTP